MNINNPVQMTKMAAMPIYGENLLLQNQWIDFNDTWHKALMAKVLNVCINHGTAMTLTYFTTRST